MTDARHTGSRHFPGRWRFGGGALLAAVACLASACGGGSGSSATAGIPPALLAQARPIGRGIRFHPPVGPRAAVIGPCRSRLGPRYGVHVELFAANRVVLVAAGIGTRLPRIDSAGRVSRARCYGKLVTLDPTGLVLVSAGARLRLSDVFRAWGQPLGERALASFAAPTGTVTVFVDGRRWHGAPGNVPLARHAEIVLEVGPYVPPHASYRFPVGT